jgi:hypothetical protein
MMPTKRNNRNCRLGNPKGAWRARAPIEKTPAVRGTTGVFVRRYMPGAGHEVLGDDGESTWHL